MSTARNRLLQLHISCVIMDIMITSLWNFYLFMPTPAGYPVGLMTTLGVKTEIQMHLATDSMLAVALSYLSLFENRYDAIVIGHVGRSKHRNLWRVLYFTANIIYVEGYITFVFWNLPSQEEGRKAVLKVGIPIYSCKK
uniref:Serpentine receptor class gamma n=2 Tax=Caenorhabditis tropicalis TaxID=1561998 RepID=A0A1I7T1H5_9PELO